jgi:hypothetical protein
VRNPVKSAVRIETASSPVKATTLYNLLPNRYAVRRFAEGFQSLQVS